MGVVISGKCRVSWRQLGLEIRARTQCSWDGSAPHPCVPKIVTAWVLRIRRTAGGGGALQLPRDHHLLLLPAAQGLRGATVGLRAGERAPGLRGLSLLVVVDPASYRATLSLQSAIVVGLAGARLIQDYYSSTEHYC